MRSLATASLALALVLAQGAAAAHPLRTGFLDPAAFSGPSADRSVLRARTAGASLARLFLVWNAVAPEPPTNPEDPEDPAYHWQSIDQQVVDTVRGGLDPLVYISASVPWGRGAAVGLPGTWPSPVRFAEFARAAARRYSGTFTPAGGYRAAPPGSLLASLERTERRT